MNIGQALTQLINILPQLMVMHFAVKIISNDLMHIMVEPVKAGKVTDEAIIESVRSYSREYGSPASWADVVFDMAPEPIRRMVNMWWYSEEGRNIERQVRESLERLVSEGRLRKEAGGYVV